MPKQRKLRIALIGLGSIAQKAYLPILANHAQVDPILCTRNRQTLDQLSRQYRIDTCYDQVDEVLKIKLDAAMVHSSTESHFPIVSKLLKAGIPVFVDKPLARSFKEAEELLDLATKNQTVLYLGLNRRFAPLVQSLTHNPHPAHIEWQKNRVDLPGRPEAFIFDDLIHVVDGLRFLAGGEVVELQVFSQMREGLLERVHVQWQQNNTLLRGMMNRVSGFTEENVEYYTAGNKWRLEGLESGWHYENEHKKNLGFDHWDSTLYKRGFITMVNDWLGVLQNEGFSAVRIQDIRETHRLCASILKAVREQHQ